MLTTLTKTALLVLCDYGPANAWSFLQKYRILYLSAHESNSLFLVANATRHDNQGFLLIETDIALLLSHKYTT